MKIVAINAVAYGSTGKIMLNIAQMVRNKGGEVYTFSECGRGVEVSGEHSFFGRRSENLLHRVYSAFSGISGTGSRRGTLELIRRIQSINPDIIHLHNLHGWYINLPILFDFIEKSGIRVVWTLHDCWGITAQCSHFTMEKCYKWREGCFSCPRYRLYPSTCVDRTRKMWSLKKSWFTKVNNMTIVTPSNWLAHFVKQSFLKDYPVQIIHNGIDLEIFRPSPSAFREKNDLRGVKIILGVASGWNDRKGLDVFVTLSKKLNNNYKVVLVGTDEKIEESLPKSILPIRKTNSQAELAEIYSAADVFFNPTREENFPTVNIEALACGTPVVTFKTGGSAEIIDAHCGVAVECDDMEQVLMWIEKICDEDVFTQSSCVARASQYNMIDKFEEYYKLYDSMLNGSINL